MHLDATANGVRMGNTVPFESGSIDIEVDLQHASDEGSSVLVQVLRTGAPLPEIVHTVEAELGELVSFPVEHKVADGRWLVVRVTDPARGRRARTAPPSRRPARGGS